MASSIAIFIVGAIGGWQIKRHKVFWVIVLYYARLMMNKTVIFSSAILMAILTIVTVFSLVKQSDDAKESQKRAMEIASKSDLMDEEKPADYSMHQTILGGDGRIMVFIPAGVFPMGGEEEGGFDESPQRIIFLSPYYIDQKEVTHKDYQRFAKMLRRPMPDIPVFEDDIQQLKADDLPVVGVTWLNATDYCKWAGKRLPTEAEWEKAARGDDLRKWPWGNTFHEKRVNARGDADRFKYTAPVGSFENGRSFYGLYDMAGNVSEWVDDWYDQFYYKKAPFENPKGPDEPDINRVKIYRGGSYMSNAYDLRASRRFGGAHPNRGESTVGFRCARDTKNSD
jgi:formylglycine-generating enzyme required for sulfatase activity